MKLSDISMSEENELPPSMGRVKDYLISLEREPLFLQGDTYTLLKQFPRNCIDCVITSPPYWGHRVYINGGIGLEDNWQEYVNKLLEIFGEVKRIIKPTGSFWLNIGDAYQQKSMVGLPWRVALAMIDQQNWIFRNSVIWNKG